MTFAVLTFCCDSRSEQNASLHTGEVTRFTLNGAKTLRTFIESAIKNSLGAEVTWKASTCLVSKAIDEASLLEWIEASGYEIQHVGFSVVEKQGGMGFVSHTKYVLKK